MADAEVRIESKDQLIAAQARIIELGDQIRDAQKAKLQEAEARMQAIEAEIRRLRGEG